MSEPVPQRGRRGRPGRALVIAGCVVLALGAGALAAIPLGGWRTASLVSAEIPVIEPGQEYRGTHYSVVIDEAWVGPATPDEYDEPDEGNTFVLVRATLRNEWREPDADGATAIRFDALDRLESSYDRRPRVRVLSDGTSADYQPGVTTEVLLQWEVPLGSVAAGEPLVFGVIDGTPAEARLFSGTSWRDEHVAVQVTLVPQPASHLEFPWLD